MTRLKASGWALLLAAILPAPVIAADAPAGATAARQSDSAGGGWTREGWSDSAPAPVPTLPYPAEATMPRQPEWREDRALTDAAPDSWRRQTWDGGRGEAYRYRRGTQLPGIFGTSRYAIRDWGAFGLAAPPPGHRWVRYYDDAVLVNDNGIVVDAVAAMDWQDRPRPWQGDGAADPRRNYGNAPAQPEAPRRPVVTHQGPGPAPQVRYNDDGSTTIIITTPAGAPVTTTTVQQRAPVRRPRR